MAVKNVLKKARNYYDLIDIDFEKSISDKIGALLNSKPESYSNSCQDFKFLTDAIASQNFPSDLKKEFNQTQPLWLHKYIYATFWYNLLMSPYLYMCGFGSEHFAKNVETESLFLNYVMDGLDWKTMIDPKSFYLPLDAKSHTNEGNKRVPLRNLYAFSQKIEVVFQIQMRTFPECLYNNTTFELVFFKHKTGLRYSEGKLPTYPTKDFLYHEFQGKTQFKF
jgi:hypothetical protein